MTARKAEKRAARAKSAAKTEPQRPDVAAKRARKPPSAPQRRAKPRPPAGPEPTPASAVPVTVAPAAPDVTEVRHAPALTPPKAPRAARASATEATVLTALTAATARSAASLPESAFDGLYTHSVRGLVRQVELLTGNPALAWRAVRRAFDLAWQRWPEVAADPDPVGWVRATAYTFALSPWQQWVPGHRTRPGAAVRAAASGSEQDRMLRAALLRLPRAQRQALLLYDGLGLDLPVAAAESEASTVAMANRITRARDALSAAVPELGEQAPARLQALIEADPARVEGAEPAVPAELPAARMRDTSERNVHRRTLAAVALTAVIAGATGAALVVTYDRVGNLPHHAGPTAVTAPAVPWQGAPEPVRSTPPAPLASRPPKLP
ncbi:sigma factor-like helix-turn-helix DNA-binding protein [Streptomyces sp. NPDC006733]|uniref:sigma factor-like helix-turn-helix DNA-binding protein n=1 Tax=Streptomyces sp. NPDC006733 TaxID=3155460 RepID=UPI0033CB97D1